MDKKLIQSMIGKIGKAMVKLVADIQTAAIEIVIHAVKHGDVTLADELIAAVGRGVRRNSLSAWFEFNGPFVLKDGRFTLNKDRAKTMRAQNEADLREALLAKKWEDARSEPKLVSVFDCSAELDKFFARIDKLAAEGKVELKHRDMIEKVRAEAARIHAIDVLRSMKALDAETMVDLYGDLLKKVPADPTLTHLQQ